MKKLFLLLLFAPLTVVAELSHTYPLSAVTTVRLSAYNDGIFTLAKSTYAFQSSTWDVINTTWTWINPSQTVWGFISTLEVVDSTPTWVLHSSSWSLEDFSNNLIQEERLKGLNKIVDDDMEIYMVWPSTEACPPDWRGWRQGIVNGKLIPVACQ